MGASTYRRHFEPRVTSSQINGRGRHINFIIWLLVGGLLGWAACLLTGTNERPGIIRNVVVGIVGVVLGGWLLSGLLGSSPFNQSEFSLAGLLVSSLGAMVLLAAVQLFGGIIGRPARTAPKRDLITYSRFLYRDPLVLSRVPLTVREPK